MKDTQEFRSQFLEKRDHTGRYLVYSSLTGCTYFVEPVDDRDSPRKGFGNINPATGQVEGNYGDKYKGSVQPSESLITKANGFDDIHFAKPGKSPHALIAEIDAKRYAEGLRP